VRSSWFANRLRTGPSVPRVCSSLSPSCHTSLLSLVVGTVFGKPCLSVSVCLIFLCPVSICFWVVGVLFLIFVRLIVVDWGSVSGGTICLPVLPGSLRGRSARLFFRRVFVDVLCCCPLADESFRRGRPGLIGRFPFRPFEMSFLCFLNASVF
jgi:hypothetical protein